MYIDRIKTENIKENIRNRVLPYIERLKKLEFVEGIVLLGGLSNTKSRNFMDKFSDVDMAIFISGSRSGFNSFNMLPDFEFHIPFNNTLLEVNVHQQFIEDEKNLSWDEGKKEAYSYTSEIFFDRKGYVKLLISEKVKFDDTYRCSRLSIILSQYYWLVNINPLRQVERGYLLNSMDLLNTGLDLLIEGVYLYNRRYRPHPKWRIEVAKDLSWIPSDFEKSLYKSYITSSIDSNEILRRREVLNKMFSELEYQVLKDKLFGGLSPYEYACLYGYSDRQISTKSYANRNFIKIISHLSSEENKIFNGLVNEYFLHSMEDIYSLDIENLQKEYKVLIHKIRGILDD